MILFVYLYWCPPWSVWVIFIGLIFGGFLISQVLKYIYYNPLRNFKPLVFKGRVLTNDQTQCLLNLLEKNIKWTGQCFKEAGSLKIEIIERQDYEQRIDHQYENRDSDSGPMSKMEEENIDNE